MTRKLLAILLSLAALASTAYGQNRIGTGKVSDLFNSYCASCHGENLQGGLGSSLVDGVWAYGGSDEQITRVIAEGIPETTMVPWKHALSNEQIRSLVIYMREQEEIFASRDVDSSVFQPEDGIFRSEKHNFTIEKVGEGEGILWALEFLPDGSQLVTQRDGVLWHFKNGKRTAIKGTPEVWEHGQGGLLEVQKHPDYQKNGWIYLGYSENTGGTDNGRPAGMTAVVRGRIENGTWVDQESIFQFPQEFHSPAGTHFGTRFVFKDGYLYFGIGDRGNQPFVQDLSRPNGKIFRIHDDGRIPSDNPFVTTPDALPAIWSYGHRNPQGLDMHPVTGDLWEVEHGPRGGDETNLIERGKNYGWPVITFGMNYDGSPMTDLTAKEGMEQPKHYWLPSIAICGIDFYEGDKFPAWKNNLFVSGMASQQLHRLVIENQEVISDEIIFKNQGRVRDVYSGPDGYLYVLLVQQTPRIGSVYRLVPAD